VTFRDRTDAAGALAGALTSYADRADVVVLGLVRGGVPVAAEVARRLRLRLDVLVVRKLGVPDAPEVAFGALGPGGVRVLNPEICATLSAREIAPVILREAAELARRERRYRSSRGADLPNVAPGAPDGSHSTPEVAGRTVLLVDDGLATGATARAAVLVARRLGATKVVLAAPVGSGTAVTALREVADEVVCLIVRDDFGAVSRFYRDFAQVSDDEVSELLRAAHGA
jgi:putative phosphoribosyl transferase